MRQGALTNEKWICTDTKSSDQDRLRSNFCCRRATSSPQPLGAPRYRLLYNTPYGLVAVDYSTDLELGFVDVFVATVMIDRVTGNFITTSSTSGKPPEHHAGNCRMFGGKTTPTVGAAGGSEVSRRQRLRVGQRVEAHS